MKRSIVCVLALFGLLLASIANAQVPERNPLVQASQAIGQQGLVDGSAKSSATMFTPGDSRVFLPQFVKAMFSDESERSVLEPALLEMLKTYEASMRPTAYANDFSAALGFAITSLYATARGEGMADTAFPVLVAQLQKQFETPAIRALPDRQKQEAYEWALCSSNLVTLLLSQASTDEQKTKIRALAGAQLELLVGAKPDQITLTEKLVAIRASAPDAPKAPASATKLAPGFAFAAPAGWTRQDEWYVLATRDGSSITAAHVRFPAAIPAAGNMGDALHKLWKQVVPAPLQEKAGGMVYRRYVGAKLFSQFIFGSGREDGRRADSVYSLFLVDCGSHWQPVVIAQTYEDATGGSAGESFSAQYSYPTSADYAEAFLKSFSCPVAPNQAIATAQSLAGNYRYGGGGVQQWQNIYTGATSMTMISSSGTLNLSSKGTFTYTFVSANGGVGTTVFRGAKGAGSYKIVGDLLICTYTSYDQGDAYKRKEERYRIGGLAVFPDGTKTAILMSDLNQPVNNVTVANSGNWYSTKG